MSDCVRASPHADDLVQPPNAISQSVLDGRPPLSSRGAPCHPHTPLPHCLITWLGNLAVAQVTTVVEVILVREEWKNKT